MDIKFDYKKVCYCLGTVVELGKMPHGPRVMSALRQSIDNSVDHSNSSTFLDQYQDSPDSAKTQAEMYVTLADKCCNDLSERLEKTLAEEGPITGISSAEDFVDKIRQLYFAFANNDAATVNSGTPLVVDYMQERIEEEGVDITDHKSFSDAIVRYVSDFCGMLKLSTEAKEQMLQTTDLILLMRHLLEY